MGAVVSAGEIVIKGGGKCMSTERFDQAAAGWDAKPRRVQLAHAIAGAIIATIPLTRDMTALEYGCGTGLVALELAPHVHKIHGLDSSPGMIKVLGEKIAEQGVTNVEPFLGDLPDLQVPLDLIYMSMTLHHIEEYVELLNQFAQHLKPGGVLALADLDKEDGTFHDDNTGIAHFGFDQDVLQKQLAQCGFGAIKNQTVFNFAKNDRDYPVFLLTAVKG
jgi:ubiquinone/menaquinone biosynthesis C-methylase UbiE